MPSFFSSSPKKSEPIFVAATSSEKPFYVANFKKFFGESATWEEAIHGDTGVRGFMLFANISHSNKKSLLARMREEAVNTGVSPGLSPHPSPRPFPHPLPRASPHAPPRLSPHSSSPAELDANRCPSPLLLSPHPQHVPRHTPHQRPQLRINNTHTDDIYDPMLLQSGGLSPHFDSFSSSSQRPMSSHSSHAPELLTPQTWGYPNHGNLDLRQTRSMPSSPLSTSAPHNSFLSTHPPRQSSRHPQHSRSSSANIETGCALFDVTNFWDDNTRLDPPCASSPVSSMPRPATARSVGSTGVVVDCGLGLEEFADMFSGDEDEMADEMPRGVRSRPPSILIDNMPPPPVSEKDDRFQNGIVPGQVDVRMSPNMSGHDPVSPGSVTRRELEMRERRKREMAAFDVPPPPKTRKELLELGWVREKIVKS